MIDSHILEDIQERIMQCMTDLYLNGEDDDFAQHIAHTLIHAHDDITYELIARRTDVSNA